AYCIPWANQLRQKGINVEIYPEPAKIKKQMSYADNKKIPYVAIVGETEMTENKVTLKNMKTGEQKLVAIHEIVF
ncbi:MAG: His/Gly/Thr/Pro-type tRNA ligase C-terminal domain-containing protein, partial [Vibrio fluvialis]